MTEPEQHPYLVWAEGVGRAHGHVIEATSFEAAVVGYAEIYASPVNSEDEVRLFVAGLEDGGEHCFTASQNQMRVRGQRAERNGLERI